jgi:hypothetical protein
LLALSLALALAAGPSARAAPAPPSASTGTLVVSGKNYRSALEGSKLPTLLFADSDSCAPALCPPTRSLAEKIGAEYAGKLQYAETTLTGSGEGHWSRKWQAKDAKGRGLKGELSSVPVFLFIRDGREVHRVASGLTGDDSELKQRQLRCLIEIALLKMPKAQAPHCAAPSP